MKKYIPRLAVAAVVVFLLIQLIPFGHVNTNPPVVSEPNWGSPADRALVKEHCFQCHSNETNWTWYANIAPASWLIAYDVIAGRDAFNFSDWNNSHGESASLVELTWQVDHGTMPPFQYWLFHPSAKMNDQQKKELDQALKDSIKK